MNFVFLYKITYFAAIYFPKTAIFAHFLENLPFKIPIL